MVVKSFGFIAFSCNFIIINQVATRMPGAQLGTLNGLAQMSSSLMRAVGPVSLARFSMTLHSSLDSLTLLPLSLSQYAASSLFALSITKHLAGGYLIWGILFSIGLAGSIVTSRVADIENVVDRVPIDEDESNPRD
jgi:hypothetical protein